MYVIKKANKVIKQKMKIKEGVGAIELDSEPEEPVKIIQQKKAKKNRSLYCLQNQIPKRR